MTCGESLTPVGGSFRDPSGQVFRVDGRIYRTVHSPAAEEFDLVRGTQFYSRAIREGWLIDAEPVDRAVLGNCAARAQYVLEHPRLPFVSYPYEWPFPALKMAALFHLDFHLQALEAGLTLSDASAFNVQFIGASPIFIDTLSLRKYRDGELWSGHRQFCEQFLNPLLLRSLLGVPHNAWYRGTQEGILASELRRLLPLRRKFSRNVLTHVVLQDVLQHTGAGMNGKNASAVMEGSLEVKTFRKLLTALRAWIERLRPADRQATVWRDYAKSHSYTAPEVAQKTAFIAEFVKRHRPEQMWDIGCNTGDYAVAGLDAGANYVVGFDSDHGALELAFSRAKEGALRFLPLYLDATNPPPSQGWDQRERDGFQQRSGAGGVIALALVHHLSIARNIPLASVVRWLVGLARTGVIEWVPKEDEMVQRLLSLRPDIFPEYTRDNFLAHLSSRATVTRTVESSSAGRLLVEFCRE